MPTQGFRHESVDGTMMGERLAMIGSGRRGWRAVTCAAMLLLLSVAPPLATLAIASDAPGGGGADTLQLSMEPVHDRVVDAARRAGARIVDAYQRSPVLVLGLAIAGALPLLAGFVALGRAMRRHRETVVVRAAELPDDRARIGDKAWIEIARGGGGDGDGGGEVATAPVMFSGELLRIGRHSDNDIALDHASVHRHHALIQRTPDQEYVLVDLTAGTGNLLLLNDRRVDRATLRDGDRITLGETGVTFHIGAEAPAGSLAPQTNRPSRRTPRETRHVERDARDEPTGRAADRIETRRLDAADRVAARRADRSRA
jgi:hypothetical protein